MFHKDWEHNIHNEHLWSDENMRTIQSHLKHRKFSNVLCTRIYVIT
jgi:hypothetical protein